MAIYLQCKCGKRLRAEREHAGRRAKCPACGVTIEIPKVTPRESVAPEQAPRLAQRTLTLTCEKCSQLYNLGQDAFALTTSGLLDSFAAVTVLSDGTKSDNRADPDLMDSCDWGSLKRADFYRNEIGKICSSTASGRSPWWQCRKCGHSQQYQQKQDDQAPLQLLYVEEHKYYPVAPVEVMVVLCDANFPESLLDMLAEKLIDVAKYAPCGEVLRNCAVKYHTATGDKNAMELVFREAASRNLNAVSVGIFEGSAFALRFSFLLAVLTTVPSGKEPHIIHAGEKAAVVLKERGA